jgi:gluconokinase
MLQSFEPAHSTPPHYAGAPTPPTSASLTAAAGAAVKPAAEANVAMTTPNHHHIFIVTGPAGCGKSTVAKFLADRYGFVYIEGDDVSIKRGVFACAF